MAYRKEEAAFLPDLKKSGYPATIMMKNAKTKKDESLFADEDKELNEFLDFLTAAIQKDEARPSIINVDNVKKVSTVFAIMKKLTAGTSAVVTYKLCSPFRSSGSVTVVGKKISFRNTKLFLEAVNLAENFDVYTKTDGTIQMDFGFNGLVRC